MSDKFIHFKENYLETLNIYIKEKKTISEIARLLEINRETLRRYLQKLDIDYHGSKDTERNIDSYLNNEVKITASALRKRLIESNIKEAKCECCGLSEWMGSKIPLELHHINGNHNDNRLENLEILCSNCHGIKHGYSMIKKKCQECGREFYTSTKQQKFCSIICKNKHNMQHIEKYCEYCGKQFYGLKNRRYCSPKCSQEAVKRCHIEKEELIEMFKKYRTYLSVSKQYNVSDKTIYKWCKKFGMPINSKDMKKFLDNN
jgi:transposase-like protein